MTYDAWVSDLARSLHAKGFSARKIEQYFKSEHPDTTPSKSGIERMLGLYNKPSSANIAEMKAALRPTALAPTHLAKSNKILIFDIETLPNAGYFFDIYSDRGIPLQFIDKAKSVCTIAYKWYGEEESHVIIAKPYDDGELLKEFLAVWEQANYAVAHYGDGFDVPFIAGRLAYNGLPSLAPVTTIDTYKLAKKHFGKSLNSNKLDHLGEIFGVGKKNKTDATLWVRCAKGELEALKEMALYNVQDVVLLEQVFVKLMPYVRSKLNMNLFIDSPIRRCKQCGSENLEHRGYEMTAATMRDRCKCGDCGSWSSFTGAA